MMGVSLGCNVNVGKGVCVAIGVEVVVSVGKGVAVNVEVGGALCVVVSVAKAAATTGWVTVFVAFRAGRIISVGETVGTGVEATMERVVALMDETSGVMIRANASGAATMLREASERLR
jgi:hypothetical protein